MLALTRRRAVCLAVCVAAADVALLWPRPAAAAAPVATGSWQVLRQTTPFGELPSTRTADDHTLPVQNSPAGALAFSAVRYDAVGATGGTLTLVFSTAQPTDPPVVQLCPVTKVWQPGLDQAWDARPSYDCSHGVTGASNPSQVTWEVTAAMLAAGSLDVALVPDAGDPTPYAVSFAAPGPDSFDPVRTTTPAPTPSGGGAHSPPPSTAASQPPASTGDVPPGPVPDLGPVTVPNVPAAQPPAVAAPATPAVPAPSAQPAAAVRGPASRTVGAGALAGFAFLLLVRSFISTGPRGRTPRSLIPTRPDEA